MSMRMYRRFDVWARVEPGRVACYRCLEVLPDRLYCVQSTDFFSVPADMKSFLSLERQFNELISEIAPEERDKMYDSIEEAIAEHDASFS
jgi:hypothetical protein